MTDKNTLSYTVDALIVRGGGDTPLAIWNDSQVIDNLLNYDCPFKAWDKLNQRVPTTFLIAGVLFQYTVIAMIIFIVNLLMWIGRRACY